MSQIPDGRLRGGVTAERNGRVVNDVLCPSTDLAGLAAKSAWLQYYHVMLVVAHVALLQTRFRTAPRIDTSRALYQLMGGASDNPYAHVVPCTILINGAPMPSLYTSAKAKQEMQRIFGLGVMGHQAAWTGNVAPLALNQADSAVEHFNQETGLCEALRATLVAVAGRVEWTGGARSSDEALVDLIRYADTQVWRMRMYTAYDSAISRAQLSIAATQDAQKRQVRQARQDVMRAKLRTHEQSASRINYWDVLGKAVDALSQEGATALIARG